MPFGQILTQKSLRLAYIRRTDRAHVGLESCVASHVPLAFVLAEKTHIAIPQVSVIQLLFVDEGTHHWHWHDSHLTRKADVQHANRHELVYGLFLFFI
jgi:hypothetical protein